MSFAKLLDLSKWNGPCLPSGLPDLSKPMIMEWDKAKEQGVVGAIVRLGSIDNTTGQCYVDGRLYEIVESAQAADMPLGYYFYNRPNHSGEVQGKFIWSILQDLPWHLDFDMDVETPGQYPEQASDSVEACADVLLSHVPPDRVDIYTSQYLWEDVIKMPPNPLWPALGLHAARWNTVLTGPWSDGKAMFRDWKTWKYWQYHSDGNGLAAAYGFPSGDVDIDLNYYNGTVDEFKKYYGLLAPDALEIRVAQLEAKLLENEADKAALWVALTDLGVEHNMYVNKNDADVKLLREQLEDLAKWAAAFPRYVP